MYSSSINIKNQHSSRLYWGIYNPTNEPMWIGNVKVNGLGCNCRCAACGKPLEAHLGSVRKHHFQHDNNDLCLYGNEIAEYMKAKLLLERQEFIALPAVTVSVGQSALEVHPMQEAKISAVCLNYDPNHYPPLLVAETDLHPIRIVLDFNSYYSREDLELFQAEAKRNSWDCIGISLPETAEGDILDADILCSGDLIERYWIFSVQADTWKQQQADSSPKAGSYMPELEKYAVTPKVQYDIHGSGNAIWKIAEYECPLHMHKYNGWFFAREEDCEKCPYNLAVSPRCLCLAHAGLRELQDLERPMEARMAEIQRLRKLNEARILEFQGANHTSGAASNDSIAHTAPAAPAAPLASPAPPKRIPTQDDQNLAGYLDVKDKDPNSPWAIKDRFGNPWHYCRICNQWHLRTNMASYGGVYGPVKGECKSCNAKRYAEARKRAGLH